MPAEECKNGMWKWGETGECKYESQAEAEEDNKDSKLFFITKIQRQIKFTNN